MKNKSINVKGSLIGIANTGNNSVIITREQPQDELQQVITKVLVDLSARYPTATEDQKRTVLAMELQEKSKKDQTFKRRLLSALRAGSLEIVNVFSKNPFVSVSIEMVKGWLESK